MLIQSCQSCNWQFKLSLLSKQSLSHLSNHCQAHLIFVISYNRRIIVHLLLNQLRDLNLCQPNHEERFIILTRSCYNASDKNNFSSTFWLWLPTTLVVSDVCKFQSLCLMQPHHIPCLLQTYYSPKTQPIFDLIFCLKNSPKNSLSRPHLSACFSKENSKKFDLKKTDICFYKLTKTSQVITPSYCWRWLYLVGKRIVLITTQELRLFMHLELYICAMNGLQ